MTHPHPSSHTSSLTFYGRRQGRSLKGLKKDLVTSLLPQLTLDTNRLHEFFEKPGPHILEIGFGGGEHLGARAMAQPEASFLGIEIFKNGIASLLEIIHQHTITNISLFPDDGRLLFPFFPVACFDMIYVLFPDPWPKKKHHSRRLLSPDMFQLMATWLKPKGRLNVASDHESYIEFIQASSQEVSTLQPIDAHLMDRPVVTRYEQKALKAGRTPRYFLFKKV